MPLSDAFRRVEPGEQPPPPPESLKTWTQQTAHGVIGGMMYGGYRGLRHARDPSIPSPVPSSSPYHRAAIFFVRESILTGSRIGLFVSVFSGAALAIAAHRAVDDAPGYAAAGALTCAIFGAGTGGWLATLPAAGFGALTAGAAKLAHQTVQQVVADSHVDDVLPPQHVQQDARSVARVVGKYEASLAAHPLRVQREALHHQSSESPSA